MTIKEIDFSLIENKPENKVFKFTNADETVYDMTGSTAKCLLYLDPSSPTEISCAIDVPNGKITIPFTQTHTDTLGNYEYILEETKADTTVMPLVKGNITIIQYTPFSESIEAYLRSELPANLTLTVDFRNQRIFYWRRILQSAFNISDEDLNVESVWPTLVNALLAKLVVYDALMLASRGSLAAFFGGDYTSVSDIGGAIRSIETGPTKVELHSSAQGIGSLFGAGPNGETPFDIMTRDLCGLANHLSVNLHMCKPGKMPIAPQFFKNPKWEYPTLLNTDN